MGNDAREFERQINIENLKSQILERKRDNKRLEAEISEIERKQTRKNLLEWIRRSVIPTIVAVGGIATAIIAALTYAKSVSDTANDRFYSLLQRLTEERRVTPENASTITVLVSRLDSEFFRPQSRLSRFLFRSEDRGFEIAYVAVPFAKAFGDGGRDTTGVVAATVLAKAISRVNDPVHRNRLVADWGNHVEFIQGKNTSIEYLNAVLDVTCQLDLLSERVGASTSQYLDTCRQRFSRGPRSPTGK